MWVWVMTVFLIALLRYVAPFLMGVSMAAAVVFGDTVSISALLAAGALWFFSTSLRGPGDRAAK